MRPSSKSRLLGGTEENDESPQESRSPTELRSKLLPSKLPDCSNYSHVLSVKTRVPVCILYNKGAWIKIPKVLSS